MSTIRAFLKRELPAQRFNESFGGALVVLDQVAAISKSLKEGKLWNPLIPVQAGNSTQATALK